jgi:hypothetical protein
LVTAHVSCKFLNRPILHKNASTFYAMQSKGSFGGGGSQRNAWGNVPISTAKNVESRPPVKKPEVNVKIDIPGFNTIDRI